MTPPAEIQAAMHDGDRAEWRRRVMAAFDGRCRLDGRLHDIIGIERERVDGVAKMCIVGEVHVAANT